MDRSSVTSYKDVSPMNNSNGSSKEMWGCIGAVVGAFITAIAMLIVADKIPSPFAQSHVLPAPTASLHQSTVTQEQDSTSVAIAPAPVSTQISLPTSDPQPQPTPTPDTRLFWDDFEEGIRSEWNMSGQGFASTNGQLTLDEGFLESSVIGNNTWDNYKINLSGLTLWEDGSTMQIAMRIQDRDNFISLNCDCKYGGLAHCFWQKIIEGKPQVIPGTEFTFGQWSTISLSIEIENNTYRTFINNERLLRFVDDTFNSGGFTLKRAGSLRLDEIEVRLLL